MLLNKLNVYVYVYEAVISRTNLAKTPGYSYYNILGQLFKSIDERNY